MAKSFKFYALKLSGIIIIIFLFQLIISGFTELFLLSQNSWIEIWRFLTSMFLHKDPAHLLYNVFALALFGSILEKLISGKKFLFVFFTTGTLANLVSINFYSSSLGASGAIFGIIGALIFIRPGQFVWAFGVPMPIFIAGILWAAGDIIGIFTPTDIANIAHLSGMAFGLIIGMLFKNKFSDDKKEKDKKIALDEDSVRKWERNWMG